MCDLTCSKKETCVNYPQKCKTCGMTSDIYNHHPMYQNKDFVEVVRCKDCVHGEHRHDGKYACWHINGLIGNLSGTEYCSYGERRCE